MSADDDPPRHRAPLDPDFVRRQLQLQQDGGEGHMAPPGVGEDEKTTVSEERAREATRNLEHEPAPGSPAADCSG